MREEVLEGSQGGHERGHTSMTRIVGRQRPDTTSVLTPPPQNTHLMHGDEHNGDADDEVDGQLVAEHGVGHNGGEDGGDGGGVLLEDGVGELEEKAGQDALQRKGVSGEVWKQNPSGT